MKLFTKEINQKLFKQYNKGADLKNQVVVAKIFNPYGKGRWYVINSDPQDSDYLWAIVQMGDIVEIGSVSRKELESIKVPPYRLPLERDLGFYEINAFTAFSGLKEGKIYRRGGMMDKDESMNYGGMMAMGGQVDKYNLSFNYNPSNLSNDNAEKIVETYTKDYKHDNDFDEVSFYVMGLSKEKSDMLLKELEMEDVYNIEVDKSRYAEGGITGDVHSLTDNLLSQKIQIFIDNVKPIKYYYIDEKSNSLVVGLDENYTQDAADKFYKEATTSMEFFDADSVDMEYNSKTNDTQYTIKLKKPVKFASGGMMAKGGQISGTFKFAVYKTEGNYFVSTQLKGVSPSDVMIKGVEGKLKGSDYNSAENVAYVILDEHDYIDRVEIIKVGASVLKNKKVAVITRDKDDNNRFSVDYFASGGMMADGGEMQFVGITDDEGNLIDIKVGDEVVEYIKRYTNQEKEQVGGKGRVISINGAFAKVSYGNDYEKFVALKKLKKMADGGIVKYYNRDNEYKIGRPSGYIEKEILERVSHSEKEFVGSFGWKTFLGKMAEGYLYLLNDFDANLIENIKLKNGEKVFRYLNRTTAIGGMRPFVKINVDKALIYFLENLEDDGIEFETRGIQANYIALIADKMAMGGEVKFADKVKSIKSSLLKRKKVYPSVQKDYGKTYSPKEAEESAKRIVGASTAKERLMAKMKKSKK